MPVSIPIAIGVSWTRQNHFRRPTIPLGRRIQTSLLLEARLQPAANVGEPDSALARGRLFRVEFVFHPQTEKMIDALGMQPDRASFQQTGDSVFDGVFD